MIDVSNNNGHVNWEKVAAAGHKIAAIKVSEGSNHYPDTFYDDAFFRYNMAGAKANGILACPYFFARPGTSAEKQARHFLTLCHSHIYRGAGKLLLDIEDKAGLSQTALIDWVADFNGVLQSVIHSLTPIYSYSAFLPQFGSAFVKHPLWVANYDGKKGLPPNSTGEWTRKMVYAHQFTDNGTCPGIEGKVDLSHRFATLGSFKIGRRITWNL